MSARGWRATNRSHEAGVGALQTLKSTVEPGMARPRAGGCRVTNPFIPYPGVCRACDTGNGENRKMVTRRFYRLAGSYRRRRARRRRARSFWAWPVSPPSSHSGIWVEGNAAAKGSPSGSLSSRSRPRHRSGDRPRGSARYRRPTTAVAEHPRRLPPKDPDQRCLRRRTGPRQGHRFGVRLLHPLPKPVGSTVRGGVAPGGLARRPDQVRDRPL